MKLSEEQIKETEQNLKSLFVMALIRSELREKWIKFIEDKMNK